MGEEIMSGQPAATLLERDADRFEEQFKLFLEDWNNYSQCLQQLNSVCHR